MHRLACCLVSSLFAVGANAATISITLDQDSTLGNASGTLLTLNFGNNVDNAGTFGSADFVSRVFTDLALFGPSNLTSNHGLYPLANLDGTTKTITGTVTAAGSFNFGFSFTETKPGAGFDSIHLDRIVGNRLRGPAMWTSIDGFFPNFYVDSVAYDALGTAADFEAPGQVPLPAGLPLLLSGLAGFALKRSRRG